MSTHILTVLADLVVHWSDFILYKEQILLLKHSRRAKAGTGILGLRLFVETAT